MQEALAARRAVWAVKAPFLLYCAATSRSLGCSLFDSVSFLISSILVVYMTPLHSSPAAARLLSTTICAAPTGRSNRTFGGTEAHVRLTASARPTIRGRERERERERERGGKRGREEERSCLACFKVTTWGVPGDTTAPVFHASFSSSTCLHFKPTSTQACHFSYPAAHHRNPFILLGAERKNKQQGIDKFESQP